jgi:hypothetical protein
MESWIDPIFLKSGDVLPIGTAARATMTRDASTVAVPGQTAATRSHGGTLRLQVVTAGRYRVSLGTPVGVEVMRGSKRVKSIAEAQGGECAPVKKKVDYTLSPGAYTLRFVGSARAIVPVFVGPAR